MDDLLGKLTGGGSPGQSGGGGLEDLLGGIMGSGGLGSILGGATGAQARPLGTRVAAASAACSAAVSPGSSRPCCRRSSPCSAARARVASPACTSWSATCTQAVREDIASRGSARLGEPISAEQVAQVLTPEQLADLSAKSGLPADQISAGVAAILPMPSARSPRAASCPITPRCSPPPSSSSRRSPHSPADGRVQPGLTPNRSKIGTRPRGPAVDRRRPHRTRSEKS